MYGKSQSHVIQSIGGLSCALEKLATVLSLKFAFVSDRPLAYFAVKMRSRSQHHGLFVALQ